MATPKIDVNFAAGQQPIDEPATAQKTYKASDFFIILIPSRSRRFFINTAMILCEIHHDLNKLLLVATSAAPGGFAASRNGCLMKLREVFNNYGIEHGPVARVMCIDDDILIDEPIGRVSETIRKADELGANIVANYKMPWHRDTIMNVVAIADENGIPHFTKDEQLAKLKNFEKLPMGSHSGLGFYYGDMPLDYNFHYDTITEDEFGELPTDFADMPKAEDVNFYFDNKIELTYVDLRLKHNKEVLM